MATNVTRFPHLCGPAPPQGPSQHWIHSAIYNRLLCHKCCIGPAQAKWTVSKSFSRDYLPQFLHLHNCSSKRSKSHSSWTRYYPSTRARSFASQNGGCVLCQWAVWLTICSCYSEHCCWEDWGRNKKEDFISWDAVRKRVKRWNQS